MQFFLVYTQNDMHVCVYMYVWMHACVCVREHLHGKEAVLYSEIHLKNIKIYIGSSRQN